MIHCNARPRRMTFAANLCLFAGIMLQLLARPQGAVLKNGVHFAAGLCLGIAIAINVRALWLCRRGWCRQE